MPPDEHEADALWSDLRAADPEGFWTLNAGGLSYIAAPGAAARLSCRCPRPPSLARDRCRHNRRSTGRPPEPAHQGVVGITGMLRPARCPAVQGPPTKMGDPRRELASFFPAVSRPTMAWCPRLSAFYGIVIWMYRPDHPPPHFHAQYGEHVAQIELGALRVLNGSLPPRALRLIREWARLHDDELDNWERAQALETLVPIKPLA